MTGIRGMLLLLLLMFAGVVGRINAASGSWRSYTSMKEVREVTRAGSLFWAATSGGLFASQEGVPSFLTYSNAEGLLSNDLTAVGTDVSGRIWVGTSTGIVQALLPGGTWQSILDIEQSEQTSKRINRFVVYGDTVLICTDFGLSVFDGAGYLFGDTYTKFGSMTNVRVSVRDAVIQDDSIWATVSDNDDTHRVAVAPLSNPNNLPPESWSLRMVGTATTRPTGLGVFGGRLYVASTSGLYFRSGAAWVQVTGLSGKNITAMAESDSSLFVCTATEVFEVDLDNTVTANPVFPGTATSVAVSENGQPVVGSLAGGLFFYAGGWSSQVPDGPNSNQFLSVVVDDLGNVWAASGLSGSGKGFYRFNGTNWSSFTKENSGLPTNEYYRVSLGCNGSVWASSWGRGVIEMTAGSDAVNLNKVFGTNVGMVGLADDSNYVVVSDVVCDPAGNEWMSVNSARNGKILAVRLPDGETWETHPLKVATTSINTLVYGVPLDRSLAVDAFGNLWGGSRNLTFKGVFSPMNGSAIEDSVAVLLTDQDGLPGSEITTLVVDRDNDIWVGTDRGIGIILDPLDPKGPGGIALYKPLNGILINTIAVDALNQKWVGTPEGVILLSSDGIQQIASYTVENTGGKLIDNDVKSIAIDSKTGIVYFGTSVGLASLTTNAAAPGENFEELIIGPNPYVIPAGVPLTVDGLVENSTLKILTIDGKLVREIPSPGGRVGFWDGLGENGDEVASGVYIIVAYSSDGSKLAAGKVAVIRR